MKEQKNKTFQTDNLALAAFLLTKGCKLFSIDKTEVRRAIFILEESEERETLTDRFWRWEETVEPRTFFANLKELKNMLFSKSYLPLKGGDK